MKMWVKYFQLGSDSKERGKYEFREMKGGK
jgi:hypothetical protein